MLARMVVAGVRLPCRARNHHPHTRKGNCHV
nr:MAG TPA: hypothetical protein [Caudoviricetes sp.]